MKNLKNEKGMTLIELMIIVSIIGILLAIALPHITGSRPNAHKKAYRLNDGKVVHCASESYMNCGVWLYNCEDGVQYNCATNVQELPE